MREGDGDAGAFVHGGYMVVAMLKNGGYLGTIQVGLWFFGFGVWICDGAYRGPLILRSPSGCDEMQWMRVTGLVMQVAARGWEDVVRRGGVPKVLQGVRWATLDLVRRQLFRPVWYSEGMIQRPWKLWRLNIKILYILPLCGPAASISHIRTSATLFMVDTLSFSGWRTQPDVLQWNSSEMDGDIRDGSKVGGYDHQHLEAFSKLKSPECRGT